jgi:drug/metabolite transporter (DMT)-like permease
LGVLAALVGMTLGVVMGAKEDFTLVPVHAHTNLLGWVSMVLFCLFYRAVPQATENKLVPAHFWLNVLGVAVLLPSLALMLLGHKEATPGVMGGSTAVLLSMAVFAVIVFQSTMGTASAGAKAAKAA